jgi:putative tricarboxylic transport membrane protein
VKKPDIAGGMVGAAIGAYVLVEGAKMPPDLIMKLGPSFFPSILAILIIAFSASLIVMGFLSKKDGGFERIDFRKFNIWRAILCLAAAMLYAFLLKPFGFIPDTILFVLALMLVLGSRKPLELALAPLLSTAGVWFVFEKLLTISLPVGLMSVFGL